jgi:hypothetical protein
VQFRDCRSDFDRLPLEFQKNLVDLISHLQDQIKPIRVYLAVETKSGPLGGLAAQIEGLVNRPNQENISFRETEEVGSTAESMPSPQMRPKRMKSLTAVSAKTEVSSVIPSLGVPLHGRAAGPRMTSLEMSADMLKPIVIIVIGMTGVGKSYFVEKATGQQVTIGDGLNTCRHLPFL